KKAWITLPSLALSRSTNECTRRPSALRNTQLITSTRWRYSGMKSPWPLSWRSWDQTDQTCSSVLSAALPRSARNPAMSGMDSMSKTKTGQLMKRLYQPLLSRSEQRFLADAVARHVALELEQCLVLDLAHPLAREAQPVAEDLERLRLAVVQPEAALQHFLLAMGQRVDPVVQKPLDFMVLRHAGRVDRQFVGHRVAQGVLVFRTIHRRVQRLGRLGHGEQFGDFLHVAPQQRSHVFDAHTLALETAARSRERGIVLQHAPRAQHLLQFAHDVHWQPDHAALVHHRPLNGLANPPRGVGGKTETALGLELVDGMHEAEIAFFDQVRQRDAATQIGLGNADHQPQVVLDHRLARGEVAAARASRRFELLFRAEQFSAPHLAQVEGQRIAGFAGDFHRNIARIHLFARLGAGRTVRQRDGRGHSTVQSPIRKCGLAVAVVLLHSYLAGKYLAGSTGLPCRRISKCSLTRSASLLPISAIFWPLRTVWSSFTSSVWLWA